MKNNNYYKLSIPETLEALKTSHSGLNTEEVNQRLIEYGYNEIIEQKNFRFLKIFLKQIANPLVYILFAAALISILSNHAADAIVIFIVIAVNAVIGFVQEYRAEKSINALKSLMVLKSRVIRDGDLHQIDSKELVPGDIILLEEGDKVPADARLIESRNFRVIESSITGESIPSEKSTDVIPNDVSIGDRKNAVFMGTIVSSGTATAAVTHTGSNTIIGEIASTIQNIQDSKSHFEIITKKLAKQMAGLAIIGAVLIFIIGFLIKNIEFEEIFLFSIASLVSSIPEGLPSVLTIVLAIGAYRMAQNKAIVRNLDASETLGIVNVIATDKTGTLTQNTMTIEEIVTTSQRNIKVSGDGWESEGDFKYNQTLVDPQLDDELHKLISAGFLASAAKLLREGKKINLIGDPTEAAFTVLGEKAGLEFSLKDNVIFELPFSSEYKFRAALVEGVKENTAFLIGAPERIIRFTTLSNRDKDVVNQKIKELSQKGLRVIAIACKKIDKEIKEFDHDDLKNVEYIGLVGMKDPIRPEAKQAVKEANSAGIRVIMLTGDHKDTATFIANDLEFINTKAIDESELLELTDQEFETAVMEYDVFARLSPQMKLKIASALQSKGIVLAMTGDGVNDAPALKQADIGISMGNIGTDTARESSEIVLSDDNFASIVKAVEEGRIIFNNIRRASTFLVTTNVAEQITILATIILGFPLPLLAPQILWLNLVTDGVNDFALAMEKSHGHVLNAKPRKITEGILNKSTIFFIILMSVIMLVLTLIFFVMHLPMGIEKARTAAFLTMSFTQIFNAVNFRSFTRSIFSIGLFSNKFLVYGFIFSVLLTPIAIYSPFFQELLRFEPIDPQMVILIFAVSSLTLWIGELVKWIRK